MGGCEEGGGLGTAADWCWLSVLSRS